MKVLIPATTTTPEVTLEYLQWSSRAPEDLRHARFVVDQCATQLRQSACAVAYAELQRLEALSSK